MTKTILVIEDDRSVARMLKDVLEAEGFTVLSERDGEFGLRTFQEKNPDLVITDVLIPKIKGFDLIQKIRETEAGGALPIIVISGVYRATMHKQRITEKHKIADYLDKPIDVDQLIDVLHDVFSSAYPNPPAGVPDVRQTSWANEVLKTADPNVTDLKSADLGAPSSAAAAPPPMTTIKKPTQRASSPEERAVAFAGIETHPKGAPIKGELAEMPFARLFGGLFAARVSGALLLRRETMKKIVYLRQGVPVFVKSNLLSECLGRVMVQERLITQEECDRSLEIRRTSTKKQGAILVEMGSISPHNLEFALELQMQAKLFDLFTWLEGKFQFNPREEYEGPQVALSLAPTAMIFEGASRAMSAEHVRRELFGIEERIVVPAKDPTFRYQALELDPRAVRLIDRIDGRHTLKQLLEEPGYDPDEAALLLYALACTSMICVVQAGIEERPSAAIGFVPSQRIIVADADIQPLNTGEINVMAEIAQLAEMGSSDLRTLLFEHTPQPEGSARLDGDAFTSLLSGEGGAIQLIAKPAGDPATGVEPAERAPAIDRPKVAEATTPAEPPKPDPELAEPWKLGGQPVKLGDPGPKAPVPAPARPPPPPPPEAMPPEEAPHLDEDVRRQVRARLEAEASRIANERASMKPASNPASAPAPRKPASGPKSASRAPLAPRLDLEKENARAKKALEDELERMKEKTHYERLGVSRRASNEEISAAEERLLRAHHPDRVVPSTPLREIRLLAERIYLAIVQAHDVLVDPEARAAYDRAIGEENESQMIAPLVYAEDVFQRGKRAAEKGQWDAARDLFREATELSSSEGLFFAHLALATFVASPASADAETRAIALFDRAISLSPKTEEVYLLRGILHQKLARRPEAIRDFEAALRLNPDSVEALRALKALEPPSSKKTGLLSRLIES
jgi:CheY-like chemotaxis protein/curved DNA-binding protein CbpA